jgi:glycosyltransferase involved in cell wall biosynthesis
LPDHILQATRGLVGRGAEVVVAGPTHALVRPALEEAGAQYVALPWVAAVPAPVADARTFRALGRLVDRIAPDVIHAHGQKAGMLARPVARRRGIPSLYTPHSFVYRTQMLRPRRAMRARFLVNRAVERRLGRQTTILTACSRDELDAAVADRIVSPARARVVYYGIAPDVEAAPDEDLLSLPGDGPLLGIVAGLRDQKGLPTLLDALEHLSREGRPVRFAIVGSGPMHDEVARRVASPLLSPTTWLRPFGGRVEPHLAALDAFVLPSYWEGLPIAVLEAMAMRLPVVASSVNGTPEAVAHERTGLLVPANDVAALAAAMQRMAGDQGLRERFGRAGREVVSERFSVTRMTDDLLDAYKVAIR